MSDSNEHRTLTDADIDAILEAAERKFYTNLGKGFWKVIWGVILLGLVGVAAVGYHRG